MRLLPNRPDPETSTCSECKRIRVPMICQRTLWHSAYERLCAECFRAAVGLRDEMANHPPKPGHAIVWGNSDFQVTVNFEVRPFGGAGVLIIDEITGK